MQVSLLTEYRDTNVCPVWIPAGINILAFFYYPAAAFPAIFLGAFINNLIGYWGYPMNVAIPASVTIAFAHAVSGGVGSIMLHKFADVFAKKIEFVKFFISMFYVAIAAAGIGTMAVYLNGLITYAEFLQVFQTWLIGDFSGIIMVIPLWACWRRYGLNKRKIVQTLFGVFVFVALEQILYDVTSGWPLALLFTSVFALTTYYIFKQRQQIALTIVAAMVILVLFKLETYGQYAIFNHEDWADVLTLQLALLSILIFHYPLILISSNGHRYFTDHPVGFLSGVMISAVLLFAFITLIL